MATSGPGATNLITAIASNWYDSVPVIYLTGQVRTWELSSGRQRQKGFQETDVVGMVKAITKYAVRVDHESDIPDAIHNAITLANTGRPGPVLIDLPMNIQWGEINAIQRSFEPEAPMGRRFDFSAVWAALEKATRPCIVIGQGARDGGAYEHALCFAERYKIPVVTGFAGKDVVPCASPVSVGMLGTMGTGVGNEAVHNADLLIVTGARLSWRQIRSSPENFAKQAYIIHVDVDENELNANVQADLAFNMSCKSFWAGLTGGMGHAGISFDDYTKRLKEKSITKFSISSQSNDETGWNPYFFLNILSDKAASDAIFVLDTGQNLVWAIQTIESTGKRRFISSWGHSPMGYSIAAVLGASEKAVEGRQVICLIGDGGLQMNIQELQTIKNYNLQVKVIVLNNKSLGAIKEFQDDNFESNYFATDERYGYSSPSFFKIAQSYGIGGRKIDAQSSAIEDAVEDYLQSKDVLLEVELSQLIKMQLSLESYN